MIWWDIVPCCLIVKTFKGSNCKVKGPNLLLILNRLHCIILIYILVSPKSAK